MEHAAKLIGLVSEVEGIFHGGGEVKDMMRNRIRSLQSVLGIPCTDAIFEVEREGLKSILGDIEDMHRNYTAGEGDGKAMRILKKTNRGLDHQPIRKDLAKFDAEVMRLFGVITTIRALNGMVAKDRLVSLWQSRLEDPPVRGAPVSIAGMGGMGKTTVAKALCDNYEMQQWRTFVVLFGLRRSSTKEVESLQRSALKELEPKINVQGWTMEQMQAKLAALVRAPGEPDRTPEGDRDAPSNILLVLDNIHSTRDAINFMGELAEWHVGGHCRVLLTGRDREILSRICGEKNTYDVDTLERPEAEQLLQQSASLPANQLETEEERQLVRRAMEHLAFCKHSPARPHYHPLATKVLGGALRGRSVEEKQQRLESFIRDHHEADREREVEQCLISSFEMLNDNHRRLFLDVALCLPSTVTRRDDVVEWCSWNDNSSRLSTVDSQLEALEQACMIKCERVFQEQLNKIPCFKSPAERRGVVTMHDLQRALAEKLASKPSLRQRRILHAIRPVEDGSDDEEYLPSEWLHSVHCEVDNIRVVLMKSKANDLDDVAHLTSNRNISVAHVMQCTELRHLPSVASSLLRSIDLSDSTTLLSLPQSWGGKHLRFLTLRGCTSLTGLPFEHVRQPNRRILDLSGCKSLTAIPALNMPKLRMLNLTYCEGLVELPNLGGLQSLEELYMRCCTALRLLDTSVGALFKLRVLNLNGCTSLPGLPVELRKCSEMVFLDLGMCALGHESLGTVFTVSKLRFLLMGSYRFDDSGLEGIEGLTFLEHLIVCGTSNLKSLPKGMDMLKSLEVLDIWNATELQIGWEVAKILADLPNLGYIRDWQPTICTRRKDLLLFQPGIKSRVRRTLQRMAPAFYEAAKCGHASGGCCGDSIVRALDICSRYGGASVSRRQLDEETFNLQALVETGEDRRVFLDNGGAQVLAETIMNAKSGQSARYNSAVALANVSASYPQELLDALDLDAWLRVHHPPGSGKVHSHKICQMVVGSCCNEDNRLTKVAGRFLADWTFDSQTEYLCMECVDALLR